MQLLKIRLASRGLLSLGFAHCTQLLYLLILFAPVCASAQSTKGIALEKETRIKVKLTRKLVSGRVRIGDYVPFVVAEDVLIHDDQIRSDEPCLILKTS